MTQWKETIRNLLNLLIIACLIILFGILCGFFFGILDLGETAGIILRTAGLVLLISLGMKLISQYYKKPLTQEMKEEEIKEADQEDTRQSLFKPTIGVLILFMIFTFIPAFDIIYSLIKNKVDSGFILPAFMTMVFFIFMWYITPVFIFTDDSVHIKSFLFYFFRIDWKTVMKYADITAVKPAPKEDVYEEFRRYRIEIFMNGTKKRNFLLFYNSDIIAKIYLRFKEKLGDKVRLQ